MNNLTRIFLSLMVLLSVTTISNGQVYKKNNVVIDGYYGFPNIMFYKWSGQTSVYEEYSNESSSSIGPVGGRVEYLLTERIGIGVEGSYAHTIINYDFKAPNSLTAQPYQITVTRFRILPRFNYHFGKSKKADPYVAGGVGYYNRTVVFSPNNPAYGYSDPDDVPFGKNWPFADVIFPIAFTAKFGFRYFFNERIGAGAEVGFGGPALTLGLSVKM